MEINYTDDEDVGLSSSIIKQVPDACIIIECSDSPTTSKEILRQEKCFSVPSTPNNTNPMKEKQQPLPADAKFFHNNLYKDTPHNTKKKYATCAVGVLMWYERK